MQRLGIAARCAARAPASTGWRGWLAQGGVPPPYGLVGAGGATDLRARKTSWMVIRRKEARSGQTKLWCRSGEDRDIDPGYIAAIGAEMPGSVALRWSEAVPLLEWVRFSSWGTSRHRTLADQPSPGGVPRREAPSERACCNRSEKPKWIRRRWSRSTTSQPTSGLSAPHDATGRCPGCRHHSGALPICSLDRPMWGNHTCIR